MKVIRLNKKQSLGDSHNAKSGVVLIVLVLVIVSIVGLGMISIRVSSGAMQSRITVGYAARAYYLAESGVEYVKGVRRNDTTLLPSGTYTLAGGDQIQLRTIPTANGVRVVSIGVANPGSGFETRRRITFILYDLGGGDTVVPIGFDIDNDGEFDDGNWNLVGLKKADIVDTGPSGGEAALDLMGTEGSIELNWQDNEELDLSSAWANNGNLLCYELQMKISPFETGNEQAFSHHYMLGFSFRLHPDTNTSYGVSFFRSRLFTAQGKVSTPPDWFPSEFSSLRGTNVYLILWHRIANQFDLINYRALDLSSGVVELVDGRPEIQEYSTLLLKLDEQFSGSSGGRENHISAYLQNVSVYPNWNSLADQRWPDDTATFPGPVVWQAPVTTTNVDSRLTSDGFDVIRPAEIAIHVFYDNAGANKKFFDDFGMKMDGFETGVDQIQY